jgi:hypothetical protein
MVGLLAARVPTEAYPRVVVVDRDAMLAIAQHRPGVPQGRTCTSCIHAAPR